MNQSTRQARRTRLLWILAFVALLYIGLLYFQQTVTGAGRWDGALGVVLGLYICSHPAGNAVDFLFFERGGTFRFASTWAGIRWLALNMLVLILGWFVIFLGATRFVARPL